MKFDWAPKAARLLNGVFCVYKPEGLHTKRVIETIKENLARDLNKLPCYKLDTIEKSLPKDGKRDINPDQDTTSLEDLNKHNNSLPTSTSVPVITEEVLEHRLVLGDRYLPEDFRISYMTKLDKTSSGILVCGIGSANAYKMRLLQAARFLNVYHVKGRFGYCTDDYLPTGHMVERTTFHHVNKVLVDKVCATIQASHQKHIFEYAGVHPESEEAYQMACRGLVRPDTRDTPAMIYSVKCIDFNLPDITLEIHAINEECTYLSKLVHDVALKLKSSAVCPLVRRIRQGEFTLEHALVRKDWHLEPILKNIRSCRKLTKPQKLVTDFNIEALGSNVKQIAASHQKLLPSPGNDVSETGVSSSVIETFLQKAENT